MQAYFQIFQVLVVCWSAATTLATETATINQTATFIGNGSRFSEDQGFLLTVTAFLFGCFLFVAVPTLVFILIAAGIYYLIRFLSQVRNNAKPQPTIK